MKPLNVLKLLIALILHDTSHIARMQYSFVIAYVDIKNRTVMLTSGLLFKFQICKHIACMDTD